jgi:hypothetical protein
MSAVLKLPRTATPLALTPVPAPAPPVRQYSFTDWQVNNPTAPPPGDRMDAEYDRANASISQVIDWVEVSLAQPPVTGGSNDDSDAEYFAGLAQDYADVTQAWAEHMPDTIPPNILAVMNITGDHWSARWWAHQAAITFGSRQVLQTLLYRATADQTSFPLTMPDLAGRTYDIRSTELLEVYVNGLRLPQDDPNPGNGDWSLDTAASTVVFLTPLLAGSMVQIDVLAPDIDTLSEIFLRVAGGTMFGPLNITVTGSNTILRSVQDRAADIANIKDFDGGANNDDALRFRNAIASGKNVIYAPPGTYTFKTQQIPPGPMNWQPVPAVLFNGASNLTVFAYGATFMIDPAMTYPVAAWSNAGNAHCGFTGNCQNVVWKGGRFYGNTTNAGTAVNTGMWFQNCTGILVEDTEWLGDYHAAPIFGGVWLFDCTFRNNRSYGSGNGFDFAWHENLTLQGNRFDGSQIAASAASTGFKLFTDPATSTFNTAGQTLAQSTWLPSGNVRQLRGGVSNNIRLIDNIFAGWDTAIYLDGIDGVIVSDNTVRDGNTGTPATSYSGITIITSSDTTTAGFVTRNIFVHNNDIYANGGAAIQIAPGSNGIGPVEVVGNRIYDNICTQAVTFLSTTSVGTFRLTDNDFLSRTASSAQASPYNQPTLDAIGAIYRRNLGAAPYDQAGTFSDITIANGHSLRMPDTTNGVPRLTVQADNNMVLFGSDAGGADRPLLAVETHSSTSELTFFTPLTTNSGPFIVTNGRLLSSLVGSNPTVAVSDGTTAGGMFISGAALNIGPTDPVSANPTAVWATLTSNLTKFNGHMITTLGGQSASYALSDGTNYAGTFMNGAGIAFGPTSNAGVPSAIWASLNGTNGLVASVPVRHNSTVGFNNTAPIAKPTVTGSQGSNTALGSLLSALTAYGLIQDDTTIT